MTSNTNVGKHQKFQIIKVEIAKKISSEWEELLKSIPPQVKMNVGSVSPLQARVMQGKRRARADKYHPMIYNSPMGESFVFLATSTERRISKAFNSGHWIETTDLKNAHQEIRKAVSNLRQVGVIILTGRAFHDEAVDGVSCWRMLGSVNLTPSAGEITESINILKALPRPARSRDIELSKADFAYSRRLENIQKLYGEVA